MGFSVRGSETGGYLTTAVSEINITPFVDVVLVLLIIFMVTAPQLLQGMEIDVPAAAAEPVELGAQHIVVRIDRDRRVFVEDLETAPETLSAALAAAKAAGPSARLYIKADREVRYGAVVEVMAAARGVGLREIGLITAPVRESGASVDDREKPATP